MLAPCPNPCGDFFIRMCPSSSQHSIVFCWNPKHVNWRHRHTIAMPKRHFEFPLFHLQTSHTQANSWNAAALFGQWCYNLYLWFAISGTNIFGMCDCSLGFHYEMAMAVHFDSFRSIGKNRVRSPTTFNIIFRCSTHGTCTWKLNAPENRVNTRYHGVVADPGPLVTGGNSNLINFNGIKIFRRCKASKTEFIGTFGARKQ